MLNENRCHTLYTWCEGHEANAEAVKIEARTMADAKYALARRLIKQPNTLWGEDAGTPDRKCIEMLVSLEDYANVRAAA